MEDEAVGRELGGEPCGEIAIDLDRGEAAGALGYVLKDAAGDELVLAVRAALGGERFVSSALSGAGARREE